MADNWYNLIEQQAVLTIEADSWLGTLGTSVITREARLRPGARSYYDHELPALAIKVVGQRQDEWTMGVADKFFRFIVLIIDRGGDLDDVVNTVQTIASMTENLLEAQYDATHDLLGLGTHADLTAGPVVTISGSVLNYAQDTESTYTVVATLEGEVNLTMA